VEYQENFFVAGNMFVQLEVFIFCPTVKIEIQSLPLLSVLITMGPESRIQLLFVFWIIKEILSKFTFAIWHSKLFF
jgi:riboflavin transporter FmnP